ncbi:MAG: class I SAM-dependent methyltransferase [Myxococcales bacterium]
MQSHLREDLVEIPSSSRKAAPLRQNVPGGERARAGQDLRSLAEHVGDDWKQEVYYDRAEARMEESWNNLVWPLIESCDLSCVVDLAAGHGRNTVKLLESGARRVYVVDINQENIDVCRQRFRGDDRVCFLRNDGFSLRGIGDAEASLVYCFDAMVHFDSDVVRSYLKECMRVLSVGGTAFLHHSNYDKNPAGDWRSNPGWRNFMSQALFLHYSAKEGLEVLSSTVIDWDTPGQDCLTLVGKPAPKPERPTVRAKGSQRRVGSPHRRPRL